MVKLINELQSKETHQKISQLINKDLSNSYVRIEVICDRKGFWLKPHCDIKEKLLSCLLFINKFNESEELGTDLYNEKLEKVKTVPYKNQLWLFLFKWAGILGMEWKRKRSLKKDAVYKLIMSTFPTDWKVK